MKSEQQLLHTEAMELYDRIIRPADKIESWLSVKNACETLSPDSVIDVSIDSADLDPEHDQILFERAIGACIYQYFFGSDDSAEREFYAAHWLLTDIVHGNQGCLSECLDRLNARQLTELTNFGFRVTNTASWGFNVNGPDNMHSLACLCRRSHQAWLDEPEFIQLDVLENNSKLTIDFFGFAPYFNESEKQIRPCMFMSIQDALWFVIGVVHEYSVEGFCDRIDGPSLLGLLEDLYDEYLYNEDIALFEQTREKITSGSELSYIGYASFNFDPSEDWRDSEISEKLKILGDFFDLAIDRCKGES